MNTNVMYDVIIIGAGPAGITAAIYTSRARLKTLVLETFTPPSQAVITGNIENYPGFPEALNGFELIGRLKKQAENFGAEFKTETVITVATSLARTCQGRGTVHKAWHVKTDSGVHTALSVIVAAGAGPRKLGVLGEEKFRGKGVSYCAICDGALFKDKDIVVVGGSDSAIEEAVFLTTFGRQVTVIHRRDRLRATKILQEKAFANKKISFLWNTVINEITGNGCVKALKVKDIKTGKEGTLACDSVFVFVGYIPNTGFLEDVVKLDGEGWILADDDMKTSSGGIFACGDVRKKILRQVVTAAGDGATAGYSARLYVEELKGTAYK